MKVIPHFCQNCGASNQLGERSCRKCGTRLMLVVFPPSIRHDEGIVPSFYEDHLLERVTLLEIRLSQVAERLSLALDLMLRQSKNTQSDHLLLETLIDSLNTLGAVKKEKLTQKWRKKVKNNNDENSNEIKNSKLLAKIMSQVAIPKKELFTHLLKEALRLLSNQEEKQALRTLEKTLEISPENTHLLLFVAETHFQSERSESAQLYLERILKIEPENIKAKLLLGLVLADSLELRLAKKYLLEVFTENDSKFLAGYLLGMISAYESDWKTALDFFKVSHSIAEIPETHYLVGCVYFQLNKYKSALKYLQKAVETDTNFADAWFMLAVIYKLIGEETKSYQSIELAWSSKEAGAECLKFMKRGSQIKVETALPFSRLKDLRKHLIMNSPTRFTKLLRGEVAKLLDE